MNPVRYFLRAISFSALRGPIRLRYIGILAGRAIGGWFAFWLIGRRH